MRNRNLSVRRNVRNNKSALVESIMAKIRPIVESALVEEEPSTKLEKIDKMISDTLWNYASDNIDMGYIEDEDGSTRIYLFYHSRNNSFGIDNTHMNVDDIDIDDLIELCDKHHIGFCEMEE